MRWPTRILIGGAIVAATVIAMSFGVSVPASASERTEAAASSDHATDMSARKRHAGQQHVRKHRAKTHRSTRLRVHRLPRRATEAPNPDRPYYRPVPNFYPFAQDRGYF